MTATAARIASGRDRGTRVHLIYPHGDRISTPDAIGRELGRRLEATYEVVYHDWWELGIIKPEPGDVLLGHPHPHPKSIFRRSLQQEGWRRRLMLAPFHHGDLRQIAFVDPILPRCDLFLAITGPYWARTLGESACSHWRPKMIPLEQAIDRSDFPPVKTVFNAPGKRRVLYIGHSGRGKGTGYLAEIAALVPEAEFAWVGGGRPIRGLTAFGYTDFSTQAGKDLVSGFDFLMMCGNADSSPTTILEAMAWGLIPICTPTCGYEGIPGITNVPNGSKAAAADIVRRLLAADESELRATQAANRRMVDARYNWDRFTAQVVKAIESTESPALLPESASRRLKFIFYDTTSPYGRVAYGPLGRLASKLKTRLARSST
jgi:glycosyltransferase involved in cell wall biosynthesis